MIKHSYLSNVYFFQVLLCITNNSIKHESFVYTQLNDKTFQFQIIQFSMSFVCNQYKYQTPIDWTLSGATTPRQNDLGRMVMKRYTAFLQASTLLKPHHQILVVERSNPSAETQLVYSTVPADLAMPT